MVWFVEFSRHRLPLSHWSGEVMSGSGQVYPLGHWAQTVLNEVLHGIKTYWPTEQLLHAMQSGWLVVAVKVVFRQSSHVVSPTALQELTNL